MRELKIIFNRTPDVTGSSDSTDFVVFMVFLVECFQYHDIHTYIYIYIYTYIYIYIYINLQLKIKQKTKKDIQQVSKHLRIPGTNLKTIKFNNI